MINLLFIIPGVGISEDFPVIRYPSVPEFFFLAGTHRYPKFFSGRYPVPIGTQNFFSGWYLVPIGTQKFFSGWYPVPIGTHNFSSGWDPVPSGTLFLKFSRYSVLSGTQIFKISMGPGRYPGTHGYRGTARADLWF